MRILEGDNMVNTPFQKIFQELGRGTLVADGPCIFLEPLPQGLENRLRKNMNMGIHNTGQVRWYDVALLVSHGRKRQVWLW